MNCSKLTGIRSNLPRLPHCLAKCEHEAVQLYPHLWLCDYLSILSFERFNYSAFESEIDPILLLLFVVVVIVVGDAL